MSDSPAKAQTRGEILLAEMALVEEIAKELGIKIEIMATPKLVAAFERWKQSHPVPDLESNGRVNQKIARR